MLRTFDLSRGAYGGDPSNCIGTLGNGRHQPTGAGICRWSLVMLLSGLSVRACDSRLSDVTLRIFPAQRTYDPVYSQVGRQLGAARFFPVKLWQSFVCAAQEQESNNSEPIQNLFNHAL